VMAGDVYGHAPYVGRGGWSWYTGSAAWMHRAAIEHLFGMQQRGPEISFTPCLPSHWDQAELALQRNGRTLRVLLCRPNATDMLERARRAGAVERATGERWHWDADDAPPCVLLRLPAPDPQAQAGADADEASRSRPTSAGAALRWAADHPIPTVVPSTTP